MADKERLFQDKKKMGLAIAVILLPVLQAGVIALFYYMKTGSGLPVPQWNDEGAYYSLVKTWLATGQPLGYWGFDGGHAIIGTGSAWSPAILFPYGVFGMMFGWNYSSAFFANLLFLCLALLLFILLVKPEKKHLLRLLLLQGLSVITVLYSTTLMSEMLRYALAIVLAGLLYRLYFGESGAGYRYVVVPLYILVAIQIYIFFVFAVPLYLFGVMKGRKPGEEKGGFAWWQRTLAALLALALAGGGSYYLLHLISSNYNIYKTERLLKSLQEFDIAGMLRSVLFMVKAGLYDVWSCFRGGVGHGMFWWFVPFLAALILIPAAALCAKGLGRRGKAVHPQECFWSRDRILYAQAAFGTALFLGAFITVYSLEAFTFFRSTGIAVIFALYLLVMTDGCRVYGALFALYAAGILFLPANMKDFNEERYPDKETRAQWETLADELAAVITIEEGNEPWENTVVLFTLEPKVLAAMPSGSGVNMMLYSEEVPLEAEYLLFSLETENLRSDWLEHDFASVYAHNAELLETEYTIIYKNANYIIYQKI